MATKREYQPVFDRVPPQNVDAERSVLGAMLLNPDAVGTAIEILREHAGEVFYQEAHQHIYSAMVALFRKNIPVDAVTLMEQLTRDGHLEEAGGASYIADLAGAVPTSANADYYAKIVLDAAVLRKLITSCTLLAGEAYSVPDDVSRLLDHAEQQIFSIAETRQLNPIYKISDLLPDAVDRVEQMQRLGSGFTGLPTGFKSLDEILSGLQPSDMIVLAARPSVGKTAFALNVATNVAVRHQRPVLVFSIEMAKEQLTQRLICMEGQVNSKRLRSGFLAGQEIPKVQHAADKLNAAPIFIDETPSISALELRSKARRHMAQYGCDLIIVDYIQLMSGGRRVESRQVEMTEISRSIKALARELHVPVIAISQLSREAERDEEGIPKLQHLRESGAIEQDADVVLMLARTPKREHERLERKYGHGIDVRKILQLIVAKQRNGPTGRMEFRFEPDMQRFGELAPVSEDRPYGDLGRGEADYEESYESEEADFGEDAPF